MQVSNLRFFDRDGSDLNMTYDVSSGLWSGKIYFEPLSVALYDNQNLYILEDDNGTLGFPDISVSGHISARWSQTNEAYFLYDVLDDPESGYPFIQRTTRSEVTYDAGLSGVRTPLAFNVGFNPVDEDKFEATLELYDENGTFAKIEFYGEGTDEDERMKVWLGNFGIKFNREDALLLKDYDIKEAMPDWKEINTARKGVLLGESEIFPYVGTYRGLRNLIGVMGFKDVLHVKEYWDNVDKSSAYFGKRLVTDVFEEMDEGKIEDLNVLTNNENVKTSNSFKKTGMLALAYQFTRATDNYDEDNLPIVESTTDFTFNEMFFKLFGLARKLREDFLPTNVRIIDIIGEFIYFHKYKFRTWTDHIHLFEGYANEDLELRVYPNDTDLLVRDIGPLYNKQFSDGVNMPVKLFNTTGINPFSSGQRYNEDKMAGMVSDIESYYVDIDQETDPQIARPNVTWSGTDDWESKPGCPVILELHMPEMKMNQLEGVTANDLSFDPPGTSPGSGKSYFTAENLRFRNIYEVEWIITKRAPNAYRFSHRGNVMNMWRLAHYLPYHGEYDVKIKAYDFFGGASLRMELKLVVVDPRQPQLMAVTRLNDKFTKKLGDYRNVSWSQFGSSKWWEHELNLLGIKDVTKLKSQVIDWYYYEDRMYDAKIFDDDLGWVEYDSSDHPRKGQWALGGDNRNITFEDLSGARPKDLYWLKANKAHFQPNMLGGFYFQDAKPGDVIRLSQGTATGFEDYEIPDVSPFTLENLAAEMNLSEHPGISIFNYSVVGDRIHGEAKEPGAHAFHFVEYVSGGSPSSSPGSPSGSPGSPSAISGDNYTWNDPTWAYQDDLVSAIEDRYPDFKRETLFLNAPYSDHISGAANTVDYWIDKGYMRWDEDGNYVGELPSYFWENALALGKIKAWDDSFSTPRFNTVFFMANNMSSTLEYEWTLIAEDTGEEVIRVKDVPFFIWRFDRLGRYGLRVVVTDVNGNSHEQYVENYVTVLNDFEYKDAVEKELDRRFANLRR